MKNTLVLSITVFALITGFTQAGTIAELSGFGPGTQAAIDEAVMLSMTDLVAGPGVKCFQIRDFTGHTTKDPICSGAFFVCPWDLADWSPVAESIESNLICLQNVSLDGKGVFAAGFDCALNGGPVMIPSCSKKEMEKIL